MFVVLSCFANDTSTVSKAIASQQVALRMIGHQVLLSVGDSSSRVLPIESEGNTHTISFEKPFRFHPDSVSYVIDSIIDATRLTTDYIVRFMTCDSNLVAHSYKVSSNEHESVLTCKGRAQPNYCYYLQIIDLNAPETNIENASDTTPGVDYSEVYKLLGLLLLTVTVLFGIIIILLRRGHSRSKTDIIHVGKYEFNPTTMELALGNEKTELTSKEADLLHLLCISANNTVDRESILNKVWGDDGDYVGRTLDVFISKLRKKLDGDVNIRIVNVRGVGYRLVLPQ